MRARFLTLLAVGALAGAHPMGNFSVSHYTRLEPSSKGLEVTYTLDLAEIPTYTLFREWKVDAKSQPDLERKATEQAREWAKGLEFHSGDKSLEPQFLRSSIKVSDGAGGLSVARIEMAFLLPKLTGSVDFEDRNFPDRAGWKEIVVKAGQGAQIVRASQPDTELSKGLTAYPPDPTAAPPQDLRASVEWRVLGAPAPAPAPGPRIVPIPQPAPVAPPQAAPPPSSAPSLPQAPGTVVKGDYLSELLGKKEISFSLMLIGIAVAFGLGSAHALTPGHGKTIVAAYLVGSRGTPKHAAFLGAMVTFTHTISVFLLGLGTLFLTNYTNQERITQVLGVVSGLSIVAIGGWLFYKRFMKLRADQAHAHAHAHGLPHHHDHDHDHHHHGRSHGHTHDHHHHHEHAHDPVHAHAHANDARQHLQKEHSHSHSHEHPPDHDHHQHGHDHDHHHGPGGHSHVIEGDITFGSLIALGASGGLVPCPSALVILLASIALGHVGLGLILLVSFSLGLAGVLMAIGMLVLYAKSWLPDPKSASRHPFFRLVPVLSAAVVVCLGLLMTGVSLGWVRAGGFAG